jgi:MFS family permease
MVQEKVKLPTGSRWGALLLIMGCITINYVDRVNLSVAVPTLMEEFGLSASQMGVLMSAFFWSYVLVMIPAGILLVKFGPKLIMGISCFLWGLATMATALVSGYASFLLVRVLLGFAEGPAYPAASQVVSIWIPKRERTLASGSFDACSRVGSAFTPPLVAWIIVTWGWQASFVVTGLIAVVYSFVWMAKYHEPDKHPTVSKEELAYIRQEEMVDSDHKVVAVEPIPIPHLFTYKKTLLLFIGWFCYLYYWNVFTTWIPAYLVQSRGFDLKAMGVAAMFPFIAGIFCQSGGGWVFDKMLQRGMALNTVRRIGMSICMFGGAGTLLMAVRCETPEMTVVLLTLTMAVYSFGASNAWALDNDIAPYGQGGTISGCKSAIGQFSGLLAPMLSGILIGTASNVVEGYDNALYCVIAVTALGGVVYLFNDYSRLVPKKRTP